VTWVSWLLDGLSQLGATAFWGMTWALPISVLVAGFLLKEWRLRLTGVAPLVVACMVASMFGDRIEIRYLSGVLMVCLPFVGLLLRSRLMLSLVVVGLLWPTAALLTQVASVRASLDTEAHVPIVPVISWPHVDARPIFDSCSVEDATHLRNMALQLATVAPEGSTIITDALPDGREGELFWPLRVLRPDLKFQSR
jgi:hypothetical protein